jgi:FkbM family methyltransferase
VKALGGGSPIGQPSPVDLERWAGPTSARASDLVHAEVQSLVGIRNLTIAAFDRWADAEVSGDLIAGRGWETKHSHDLCLTFQRHGGVGNFLDVGANIGTFTIPLADCLAHAGPGRRPSRVIAVEAMPPTADHLLAGIKENNLTNVDMYTYAVGAPTDTRRVTMSLNPVNKGGSSVKGNKPFTEMDDQQLQDLFHPSKHAQKFARKVEVKEFSVELTTADNMLHSNPVMKAILIAKVDIEGHEGHFIKGAKTLFSKHPPCYMTIELVPEWLKRAGTPVQEILDLLTSWDYKNVPTVEAISKGPIETKTRTIEQKDMAKCIARIWSNLPSNFMVPI